MGEEEEIELELGLSDVSGDCKDGECCASRVSAVGLLLPMNAGDINGSSISPVDGLFVCWALLGDGVTADLAAVFES